MFEDESLFLEIVVIRIISVLCIIIFIMDDEMHRRTLPSWGKKFLPESQKVARISLQFRCIK